MSKSMLNKTFTDAKTMGRNSAERRHPLAGKIVKTQKYFFIGERPQAFSDWQEKLSASGHFENIQFEEISADHVQPEDTPLLIVSGGDGSLNYATNWLYEKNWLEKVEVLYHPDGTGNDFARSVDLNPQDLQQSIDLLAKGQPTEIFLAQLDDKILVNMATCGVFAQVTPEVDPSVKSFLGSWSYYLKGLEKLTDLQSFTCSFQSDKFDLQNQKVFGFFIAKSRFSGGGVQVSANQSPTKNSTDFFLVREMPLAELVSLGIELQKDNPDISEFNVVCENTKGFSFQSETPVAISLDGEQMELKSGKLRMCPQTLKIYLP